MWNIELVVCIRSLTNELGWLTWKEMPCSIYIFMHDVIGL